jgi:predicted outer membrane repeat protein
MTPFYYQTARFAPAYQVLFFLLLTTFTTQAQVIRYVSMTGTNANPATATSWATSTNNLQGAINASAANDQVWVRAGTYKPTTTTDRSISFNIPNGVKVYGGFAGTETTTDQRPAGQPLTTLSGEIGNTATTADNSYHVVQFYRANTQTRLDGFAITGGNANDPGYPNNVGGGIYNDGSSGGNSSPTISNCLFVSNAAFNDGGAIYNDGNGAGTCSPALFNCAFQANSASSGGAITTVGTTSSPRFVNCSFQGNSASQGGAMFNYSGSPRLQNCAFFDNGGANTFGGVTILADFSLFDDTVTGYVAGSFGSNLTTTVSPFASPTTTQLRPCSPAIDAGLTLSAGSFDLAGNSRLFNNGLTRIDIGAYEFQGGARPSRVYVRASATGANNGTSWANAFTDLQSALNLSCLQNVPGLPTPEVWVASGVYKPTAGTDRTISFVMKNGVVIYGGFVGTETALSQRPAVNPVSGSPSSSTLSGDIGVVGNRADNSLAIINNPIGLNNSAILNGFVIVGGNGNFGGGGMYNNQASPTVENCLFLNNSANNAGAMYNHYGAPRITNCSFQSNSATNGRGGAVYNNEGNTVMVNCLFQNNRSFDGGGAIYNAYCSPALTNCSFQGNLALQGAAIYNTGDEVVSSAFCRPVLTNCSFQGNVATEQGGVLYNFGFSHNSSIIRTSPTLINCVLFGNGANPLYNNGATITATYSVLETTVTGFTGSDNIITNISPFATPNGTQLACTSPALNSGLNSATGLVGINTDLAGNPRITLGTVDRGAYEYFLSAGVVGGPPIVPSPQEFQNLLSSLTVAAATNMPLTLRWQQSDNSGSSWTDLPNSNAQTINLPSLFNNTNTPKTFLFRRSVTDGCSQTAVSNNTSVQVFFADGRFTGKVVSNDGFTPVPNVVITVVRTTTGLAGSPNTWTYTAQSANSSNGVLGTYTVAPIYFGVPPGTVPTSASAATFVITPSYTDPSSPTLVHVFSPASQTVTLQQFVNPVALADFKDLTTFAIAGQTRQVCPDCITGFSGQTPLTGTVTCPVDSIPLNLASLANPSLKFTTKSGYLDAPAPADYGRFAFSVGNPGTYSLSVTSGRLVFTNPSRNLNVTSDVYNQNFDSPTSQTITGRVSAGCNEATGIGSAVLEFTDILTDKNGNSRPSCFKKQVTTNASGYYQITLPPRKYRVRAISLSPTADVASPDFVAFINNLPADSLTRDLTSTTGVVTLNVVYQRPPTLVIAGLATPAGCSTAINLMEQGIPTSLTVSVFQGPVSKNCPVASRIITSTAVSSTATSSTAISGTLLMSTEVQGSTETFSLSLVKGVAVQTLLPGDPNILPPYDRPLTVQFTDLFGRTATAISRRVIVKGFKGSDRGTNTSTPQIPWLILHDPPGKNSYSFWQNDVTHEQAIRLFAEINSSTKVWGDVKIGAKTLAGFGVMVGTETYGQVGAGLTFGGRGSTDKEFIMTSKSTRRISTSSSPSFIGASGDVFVGGAINFDYSVATTIDYDPASCTVVYTKQFVLDPTGTKTEFYFTELDIKNQIIVKKAILNSPTSTTAEKGDAARQIDAWEKTLALNARNKAKAQFVRNGTYGSGAPYEESITAGSSQSDALEIGIVIDSEIAVEAGFEFGGSGFKGGVTLNFKVETGASIRNNSLTEITTGFVIDDGGDAGDLFSVDIKKDPVYKTAVFDVRSGYTSCPPEPNTLPRDAIQVSVATPVVTNVPNDGTATFILDFSNASQVVFDTDRTFRLSLVENQGGALVTIDGSGLLFNYPVTVTRDALPKPVTIRVRKDASSNVFAYENIQFKVTDDCGGDVLQTISLGAFFQSPCSSVSLIRPEPNWVTTQADNTTLLTTMIGYNVANLTNIALEYTPRGVNAWQTGFTRTQAQLNNSVNGTDFPWLTPTTDGAYDIRLKLTCPLGGGAIGTVYSQRVSGIVDKTAPVPFGNTQPLGDAYVLGSTIGISYNELLGCSRLTNNNVVAKRRSNGQVVPLTLGCYGNQIALVPTNNLLPLTGEIISLTLTGITDLYGNPRTTPDVWAFQIGSSTAATGTNALSVSIANSPMSESATGTMRVVFRLAQNTDRKNVLVNFSVGGTAQYGIDYTATVLSSSTMAQPLSSTMNGIEGSVLIPNDVTSVTLLIDPTNETLFEPDETVLINLIAGGDYQISAASSVTGIILNDDAVPSGNVITSIKTGNWEDASTWDLNRIPILTDLVIIDQNHTVTLTGTGNAKNLSQRSNAKLRMAATTTRLRLGF